MRLNQSQFAINLLYFIAVTHEHIIFNNFVGSIGFSFRLNIGRLTQKSLKGSIQSLSFLIQVQHSFLDSHYSQKIYLQNDFVNYKILHYISISFQKIH